MIRCDTLLVLGVMSCKCVCKHELLAHIQTHARHGGGVVFGWLVMVLLGFCLSGLSRTRYQVSCMMSSGLSKSTV